MKVGYARVSTDDQNPALQLTALEKAGCKTLYKDDGISGATTKRPALLRCLKKLEPGDTLIVWKLDRLGRSLRDLIGMLDDFKQRGIKFKSITEAIDTETPTDPTMAEAAFQHTATLATSRPVFNLPPGFTAYSLDGCIQNNAYLCAPASPVPLPTSLTLLLGAGVFPILAVASRRRRTI